MKINEGAFRLARGIAQGMGWGRAATILVRLGIDRDFGIQGTRRIRKKKMKRLLQRAMWQSIFDQPDEVG